MRGFLATLTILAVVGLTMLFFGWLTFTETPDGAGATVHTERIEEDVQRAVETTEEVVSDVIDETEERSDPVEGSDSATDDPVRGTGRDEATEPVNREVGRPIE